MAVIGIAFPLLAILVPNFWYVLGMRGILGLALGFASAVCPMYSSTIVDDSVKRIMKRMDSQVKAYWARRSSCPLRSVS